MSESTQTSSSLKKRKFIEDHTHGSGSSHKKVKKDKEDKKKPKGKRSASKDGQFQVVNASVMVSIPPKFAMDPMTGAREMLDSLIMHYVPALGGVMICHSNARFLSQTAVIKNECPFSNCAVGFDATVWGPQIGMKLNGKINLCSPDHVSLLVHQTFNVSIPRHHIPIDSWEFEHGPAENDPEFGPNISGIDISEEVKTTVDADAMDTDGKAIVERDPSTAESIGSWVHRITNDKLGGPDGNLEFTVIGLTVANQMLSLVASIQPDPFSPEHVPKPIVAAAQNAESDPEDGDDEPRLDQIPDQLDDDSDDEDPFSHLGRVGEETKERIEAEKEQKAKEKEEKKRHKRERKRRKKAGKAEAEGKIDPPSKKRKKVKEE